MTGQQAETQKENHAAEDESQDEAGRIDLDEEALG